MNYDFIREDILSNIDIVDLIGSYINLKKSGDSYEGLCPFHNEKTASFKVNSQKQLYKCFGCGEAGNAYSFVMKYENIDFKEAMEKLALRINYTIPKFANKNERLYEINIDAAKFFYYNLTKNENAKNYLYNRISNKITKKFGVGFSLLSWDSLYKYLKSKSHKEGDILSLGLLVNKNGKTYDRFRGRIMFPIFSPSKKIIGFGGRVTDDLVEPKYLNSPESILYNKSSSLYGINFLKGESVILVEGYMDVLSLHNFGFENAVASLGTAFTEEHAKLLKNKRVKKVIIVFDSDAPGQRATEKAISQLLLFGIETFVLTLQNAKDPDEFLKKYGRESFLVELEKSENYLDYCINSLLRKYNIEDVSKKREFLNSLAFKLTIVSDKIELEAYVDYIVEKFKVSKEVFMQKIKEVAPINKNVTKKVYPTKAYNDAVSNLLCAILNNQKLAEEIKKHISYEECNELYEEHEEYYNTKYEIKAINDHILIVKKNYIDNKLKEKDLPIEDLNDLLKLKRTLKKDYIDTQNTVYEPL